MEGFELREPDPTAFRDVPRLLAGMTPASAPDTVFAYCNAGYSLLVMAKEDVAEALAERIASGRMTPVEARGIARRWFFDNPHELYRIPLA